MNELTHHGVQGQKWGIQNGPPYPLDYNDHSAKEKRAMQKDAKRIERQLNKTAINQGKAYYDLLIRQRNSSHAKNLDTYNRDLRQLGQEVHDKGYYMEAGKQFVKNHGDSFYTAKFSVQVDNANEKN